MTDAHQFRNCLYPGHPSISLPLQNMAAWSADGSINCLCNLRHRRIFVQSGTMDEVVGINITSLLHEQLVSFASPSNVQFVINEGFAHGMPTDANDSRLSPCNKNVPPFVGSCGYDGAGAVLKWLHNDSRLNDRNAGTLTGEILAFAQSGDFGAPGFADTGYMYMPACCNSRLGTKATATGKCKLHVVLHGCTMNYETIGDLFVKHAGYNAWADTNDIVVLYPQTTVDSNTYPTWSGELANENACFDWIGQYGDSDRKGGLHMQAIVNMVRRVAGSEDE